jgi:hypothetical protein
VVDFDDRLARRFSCIPIHVIQFGTRA